jgi:hypothetical protein
MQSSRQERREVTTMLGAGIPPVVPVVPSTPQSQIGFVLFAVILAFIVVVLGFSFLRARRARSYDQVLEPENGRSFDRAA